MSLSNECTRQPNGAAGAVHRAVYIVLEDWLLVSRVFGVKMGKAAALLEFDEGQYILKVIFFLQDETCEQLTSDGALFDV